MDAYIAVIGDEGIKGEENKAKTGWTEHMYPESEPHDPSG
jgi:hypothetical protein